MKAALITRRYFVFKLTSSVCSTNGSTGRMMKCRQKLVTDECPRYHQTNEDADHIWQGVKATGYGVKKQLQTSSMAQGRNSTTHHGHLPGYSLHSS
jgi:hypothetical protein